MEIDYKDVIDDAESTALHKIRDLLDNGTGDIAFFLGHGTHGYQTFQGLYPREILPIKNHSFLWLHGCGTGLEVAPKLAKDSADTFGFLSNIFLSTSDQREEGTCKDVIEACSVSDDCHEVREKVQAQLKGEAIDLLKQGDILSACVYNHLRLSLRAFPCRD